MNHKLTAIAALLVAAAGGAQAQSSVTLYGRVDLSLRQAADAVKNREVANGSGSRIGVRGFEDLGGGLRAVFQLEHRFNADTGAQSTDRYWEGKSIVGLEGSFGRISLGREENPAYTYSQYPADPFTTDTVAANGTIINGRIGTTRYSNSVNYRFTAAGFSFGAQISEADGNTPAGTGGTLDDRPYALGLGYAAGPITVGIGYENPADEDDAWLTVNGAYDFGVVKVGGLYGSGRNVDDQKVRSYLVYATAPIGAGELRASYGRLENRDTDVIRDKQFAIGYHYALSKRTTVYADVTRDTNDRIEADSSLEKTGYDIGLKHNF